jgi:uncharacterized protein YceH (UPF0502 family)
MKTIGTFSENPKEQARQTRDLEANSRAANSALEKRVAALESEVAELRSIVEAL